MEGRDNTLERRVNEQKMGMAEWRRDIQEIKEMLQEIKIHIMGSERSEKAIMRGKKDGSEEELEEDRGKGQQNWRQRVELPRFEGLDPLGWISQVEKFFDTQNITEKERLRLAYNCMEGGTIYWFRAWKNKTKNLSWKGLKEALIIGFGERDRGFVFEKLGQTAKITEAADEKVVGVATQGVAKAALSGKERERDISAEDKNCDGGIVCVAAQEVAEAAVSRRDSGVGCDVYDKTVKKGEDRGKKAEYGGNRATMMAGNKVEDAAVLSGEKIWLSQTYKTLEDQWQRYFFAGLQFNIQRKQLAQHDDDEGIGWSDQQVLSFLASRMNKFGQGEGFASTIAIKIQKRFWGWKKRKEFLIIHQKRVKIQAHVSGHQVRRQYRRIIGSMGILEKKQLLKESTILSYRPPPKPPDLNWRQQPVGSLPMMKMSHGNKHYCTNLEDKVVLQQGVMIGFNMTCYDG
ncbi:hypothetical protein VIGAN_01362400 [Vigna angularis var. angularis]|uniref:Retrotransposon gag domain-containing protein n=1 Tax=Vigna angularis var. angularis TaxID=157739 RepID=A0A0S3R5A5_PHAAN|nr:hypothetical protein VIGAN_01362400 [Vigna angularis var. angularis]